MLYVLLVGCMTYNKLYLFLSAGETTYSLEHANDLRVEIQKVYEFIDALR